MAQQVKAIPDGYHTITPGLTVRDGAKAVEFYKRAFGAQQVFRMDRPDGRLMHAELQIGTSRIMLGEEYPQQGCQSPESLKGTPVSFYLYVPDADAAFAQAIAAGAKAVKPVSDMFWGDRQGEVSDPFGHRWSVATHQEDLTPEQIGQRSQEFFASLPQSM